MRRRKSRQKNAAGIGRREALRRLVAGAGASTALPVLGRAAARAPETAPGMAMPEASALGAAQPPDPSLSAKDWKPKFFDEHENETVILISGLLIPDTDTPGAKAAQVNRFIDLLLNAEPPEVQKQYLQALGWLDGHCLSTYSKPFAQLGRAEQIQVLTLLTHKVHDPQLARGSELFAIVKRSIVGAYYSSGVGALQELKYQTNPFQPEFPGCKNPDEHN